jgi:pilus assembly protein FimV
MDNPFALPGAVGLVALLVGLGLYRARSGRKKSGGETSFLESRLQPDSFFGASGGQRIDTREAAGSSSSSSSMSYSLSQLDAIGDVDPVAEADVYLAYGRDLQAEEILKEAMRTNPDRMAVRTKLLEVYAKRRDTKGFELLAVQLFALTKGAGADWEKAQTMGRQVDPENPLYQVGGHPANLLRDGDKEFVEPLGATTLPASSIPHGRSDFQPSDLSGASPSGFVDLDLDLGAPSPSPSAMETTRPLATSAENMPPPM